jgi:hypothetical protein
LVDAALGWAAKGYAVFPCLLSKKPAIAKGDGGRGWKDATRDPDQIRALWARAPHASSIGAAHTPTGTLALDIDSKAGADPDEVLAELGLEHHPHVVHTGEAPEPSDRHPNSLSGVRGRQLWFRGEAASMPVTAIPGVELRARGYYSILPPSPHPSGVAYLGDLPPVGELAEWPQGLADTLAAGGPDGEPVALPDEIPHGAQHNTAVSIAGTLRRRGLRENEIFAALAELAKRFQVKQPDDLDHMRNIARDAAGWEPDQADWLLVTDNGGDPSENVSSFPIWESGGIVVGRPHFSVIVPRAEDIRAPRFLYENRILVGAWNGVIGPPDIGKGTTQLDIAARATRGELPGCRYGQPVVTLLIGSEDNLAEVLVPRLMAAGADLDQMRVLKYDDGVAPDLVGDLDQVRAAVVENGVELVLVDQVLDHIDADVNTHGQHDVRRVLGPMGRLADAENFAAVFTAHPNKATGVQLRDRMGGSSQFLAVPRCVLALGWHPDRPGYRALVRVKGNVGKPPLPLVFTIESDHAVNPDTGEAVEAGRITGLEEDLELDPRAVTFETPKEREDPKQTGFELALLNLGDDGGWHSRKEAKKAAVEAGISAGYFDNLFAEAEGLVEKRQEGRETWWRLKDE